MRIRFIEKDYWISKIKKNSTYITGEEIENLLPEADYVDLTFIFAETVSGFKTTIIDNNTNKEINVDELNPAANTFYIGQIYKMSLERMCVVDDKAKQCISSIKEMMKSWSEEKAVV